MRSRSFVCIAVAVAALLLSGCGSLFDKEYVTVSDYTPTVQEDTDADGKVTVRNFAALKQALLELAYSGAQDGIIVFDQAYEGDSTEDMASACWQVRTQDALCAYCVENIAYELNKIVTINEADIHVSYSDKGQSPENIAHLSYSSGIQGQIKSALEGGQRYLAVLVGHSAYDAEQVEDTVTEVYRENPTLVPREPTASVNMFSGTGTQRLYEISINYGMTAEELKQRTAQLRAIDAFAGVDTAALSEAQKAVKAYEYIKNHCRLSAATEDNTAYSALVDGFANSEGMAFAYVELCRQLGLDCRIVYGQRHWEDHSWNIVRVDGSYYHVDLAAAAAEDDSGEVLLRSDEQIWGEYRWDVASYPKCSGELSYSTAVE